jgi:hypothetical protein
MNAQEKTKAIERNYAHFHRLLSELLLELAELPGVVWLEEAGHVIRGEGESNDYRKAIYPLQDATPYYGRLAELRKVQKEGLELLDREEPPVGLLMPVLLEGVQYVRLRRHVTHSSRASKREHALARFEEHLVAMRANLKKFEYYASSYDPRREKLEAEVRALEEGLERLRAMKEETLRERYRHERVLPYVYLDSGEIIRPYVRDVGLMVAGPRVRIVWVDEVRRTRSDKVRLEPLLVVGQIEVYSETEWQETNKRTKSERSD